MLLLCVPAMCLAHKMLVMGTSSSCCASGAADGCKEILNSQVGVAERVVVIILGNKVRPGIGKG